MQQYRQPRHHAPPGRHYYCEGHMIIGFILTLTSAILLLLVTLSTPYIPQITFLTTSTNFQFGAFGYCSPAPAGCIHQLTYSPSPEIIAWLSTTNVLFPLSSAFMFITWILVILGMCEVGQFSWNPRAYRTCSIIGTLSAIIAEIFALVQWVTARNRFLGQDIGASYGAALWMGLAAAIISFVATCIGGPAFSGSYMYSHDQNVAYNL